MISKSYHRIGCIVITVPKQYQAKTGGLRFEHLNLKYKVGKDLRGEFRGGHGGHDPPELALRLIILRELEPVLTEHRLCDPSTRTLDPPLKYLDVRRAGQVPACLKDRRRATITLVGARSSVDRLRYTYEYSDHQKLREEGYHATAVRSDDVESGRCDSEPRKIASEDGGGDGESVG
ncbi:hypothetical protein EVAR_28260_1 [Eumeta japonica]|uniref:Uncharacterized protein n=1 Tax=Eumeta variegata TaxID=151549 RepID=A0A4C1V6S4_EUMVA|nr:hypothetical protein EVAR_28260_1 [Eumeta japonica]